MQQVQPSIAQRIDACGMDRVMNAAARLAYMLDMLWIKHGPREEAEALRKRYEAKDKPGFEYEI